MSRVEGRGAPVRAAVVVCVLAAACGACDSMARKAAPAEDGSETVNPQATQTASPADKGGGTGTRARGEEGSMGNPSPRAAAAGQGIIGLMPQASAAPGGGNWASPPPADEKTIAPAAHLDPNARY